MTTVRLRSLLPVVLTLTLAACSSQTVSPTTTMLPFRTQPLMTEPIPAVDLSATPTGWVPVAYRDAQISVPSTWSVLYNSSACQTGPPGGDVYINPSGGFCSAKGTPKGKTTVTLVPLNEKEYQPPTTYGQRRVINGITVYETYSFAPTPHGGSYLVPSLGVEIEAEGPLAHGVVDTLSRSPRAVALASGSAPSVPSSWQSVSFAGLRFSVPANWTIYRTQLTPGLGICGPKSGVEFLDTTLTLSTDLRPLHFPCALPAPTAQPMANGVQVDSGLRTEPLVTLSFSKRCLKFHGLTACPATTPAYSILVLRVTVPGHRQPVYVSIGLAGNGVVARTILYSLRAASSSEALGSVTGSFVAVGGPAPGSTRPLPGQVTAQNSAGHKFTVAVGKSGKFVLWLPAGVYRLTGRSPMFSVNGVEGTCAADQPVLVRAGKKTLGVEVVCLLK